MMPPDERSPGLARAIATTSTTLSNVRDQHTSRVGSVGEMELFAVQVEAAMAVAAEVPT
jgi:hypothetical protein